MFTAENGSLIWPLFAWPPGVLISRGELYLSYAISSMSFALKEVGKNATTCK